MTDDRTVLALFSQVKNFIQETKCTGKVIGQGYDEAAVMASDIGVLQALVKSEIPDAFFIHCCAHVLNLVLSQVAKQIPKCRIFF